MILCCSMDQPITISANKPKEAKIKRLATDHVASPLRPNNLNEPSELGGDTNKLSHSTSTLQNGLRFSSFKYLIFGDFIFIYLSCVRLINQL